MLLNNLHTDVAENPDDLVVYGERCNLGIDPSW